MSLKEKRHLRTIIQAAEQWQNNNVETSQIHDNKSELVAETMCGDCGKMLKIEKCCVDEWKE